MEFQPEKCKILNTSRNRSLVSHNYKFKGAVLEPGDSAEYLGVQITNQMKRDANTNKIVNSRKVALGFLKRNTSKNSQDLNN